MTESVGEIGGNWFASELREVAHTQDASKIARHAGEIIANSPIVSKLIQESIDEYNAESRLTGRPGVHYRVGQKLGNALLDPEL